MFDRLSRLAAVAFTVEELSASATASTPMLTPRYDTTRSLRRWRGKYRTKTRISTASTSRPPPRGVDIQGAPWVNER